MNINKESKMKFKREHITLKIGDYVEGSKGKHRIKGHVMESTVQPGKPAVFSKYGFVGVWVKTDEGKKKVINNIRRV